MKLDRRHEPISDFRKLCMAAFSVLLFASFPLLPFNKRKRFYELFDSKNKMLIGSSMLIVSKLIVRVK